MEALVRRWAVFRQLGRDGGRMTEEAIGSLDGKGAAALSLMHEALTLLDQCKGTSEVGAHLDLAICRLRDLIAREASRGSCRS